MFYDASGVRYLKQHYLNGSTIIHRYVTDEGRILSEDIKGGEYAGTLDYIYLGNQVVGFGYKNKKYFYLKNLQGDIVKIYDENNTLFVEYEYDAWGNHTIKSNINSIGTINPFRYRGYYYDSETNLYYCQTRYYNPELCRWMSLDDIGYAEPSRINGFNLYAYCGNNPVMFLDSSGCSPTSIVGQILDFLDYTLVYIGKALVTKGTKIIGDLASKSLYLLDDIGGAIFNQGFLTSLTRATSQQYWGNMLKFIGGAAKIAGVSLLGYGLYQSAYSNFHNNSLTNNQKWRYTGIDWSLSLGSFGIAIAFGGPVGLIFGFASSLVIEYTPLGDKLKDGADWVLDEAMPTVQRVFNKFPKIGR